MKPPRCTRVRKPTPDLRALQAVHRPRLVVGCLSRSKLGPDSRRGVDIVVLTLRSLSHFYAIESDPSAVEL